MSAPPCDPAPKPTERETLRACFMALLKIDERRCFAEDIPHENGNYECRCASCGEKFLGHKRRITCKTCVVP